MHAAMHDAECAQQCMQRCTLQCCADAAFTLACASWHALVLSWALCTLTLNGVMTKASNQAALLFANDQQRLPCAPLFHAALHARRTRAGTGAAGTETAFANSTAAMTVAADTRDNSMRVAHSYAPDHLTRLKRSCVQHLHSSSGSRVRKARGRFKLSADGSGAWHDDEGSRMQVVDPVALGMRTKPKPTKL
eukprot:1158782-Pelagomonas_calceolata.AAC.2